MTRHDLTKTVERLERKISSASPETRLALQPQLHQVLLRLKVEGKPVPPRLRALNAALIEEQFEDCCNNMPL